eukprot:jgi/Mesvir1/21612/Mv04038-RA.1
MCRFMVYLGQPCLLADLVTKPNRSLTRQSYEAKERLTMNGYLNGDGFGIGWYLNIADASKTKEDQTPCVFTSTYPAWNNVNLARLAKKIIAPVIFAHVRAAYPGIPVSEQNCQPFSMGRYIWMHNGGVGNFAKVRRRLLSLLRDDVYEECQSFQSDSAICFAIFMNQLESSDKLYSADFLREKMDATIRIIAEACEETRRECEATAGSRKPGGAEESYVFEPSLLNFCVSDGKTVVATRYCNVEGQLPATLYYATGSRFECTDAARNVYSLLQSDRRSSMAIVSSEPITDHASDWMPVPPNYALVMQMFKGDKVDIVMYPLGLKEESRLEVSRSLKALDTFHPALSRGAARPLMDTNGTCKPAAVGGITKAIKEANGWGGDRCSINTGECGGGTMAPEKVSDPAQFGISACNGNGGPRRASYSFSNVAGECARGNGNANGGWCDLSVGSPVESAWRGPFAAPAISGHGYARSITFSHPGDSSASSRQGSASPPRRQTPEVYYDSDSGSACSVLHAAAAVAVAVANKVASAPAPVKCNIPLGNSSRVPVAAPSETTEMPTISRCTSGVSLGGDLPSPKTNGPCRPESSLHHHTPITCVPNHCLTGQGSAVLAITVLGCQAFTGSHDGVLRVFCLKQFACTQEIAAHDRSIFSLTTKLDRLYSSTTRVLKIWDITTFTCLSTIMYSSGDIYGLALKEDLDEFALAEEQIAAALASPMPLGVTAPPAVVLVTSTVTPIVPPVSAAVKSIQESSLSTPCCPVLQNGCDADDDRAVCGVPLATLHALRNLDKGGHCALVYAMSICGRFLCTGAGDATIKVWDMEVGTCRVTLRGHKGSVLTLADFSADGDHFCLFSGARDNTIRVWDMSTMSCRTVLVGHRDDVLGLTVGVQHLVLYSASADRTIRMWDMETYECVRIFSTDESMFLCIAATLDGVLSGSSDGSLRLWKVDELEVKRHQRHKESRLKAGGGKGTCSLSEAEKQARAISETMEETLKKFVSIQSVFVAGDRFFESQCWIAAKFVVRLLQDMGADVSVLTPVEGSNPIVLGSLVQDPKARTVCFYGHYDVYPVVEETWSKDPYNMVAEDGFLFGRGTSDSKGPLLCQTVAVKELLALGKLNVNVRFLFDGMQEAASVGFIDAVESRLDTLKDTDVIVSTSGRWHDDARPCLVYGMRGMMCIRVTVEGARKDLHSGNDGGTFTEPLNDLVTVLSNLVDSRGMILVPGFYEDVAKETPEELALLDAINFDVDAYRESTGLRALSSTNNRELLMDRWRNPSLSIVGVESSCNAWSLLPHKCSGKVVIRHVPNQDAARLEELFRKHVQHEFAKLRSCGNTITVTVENSGDWWLGDMHNEFFAAADDAIRSVWGMPPLYVREGGTFHVTSVLEKRLHCPALLIPISQATNNSHIHDERLRLENLVKGKDTVKQLLLNIGELDTKAAMFKEQAARSWQTEKSERPRRASTQETGYHAEEE